MEGGDDIVDSIVAMVQAASDAGATIIASRDYHPHDHCSFAHAGGHFPSHCVQGTSGSKFLPEIARALECAMRRRAERKLSEAIRVKLSSSFWDCKILCLP